MLSSTSAQYTAPLRFDNPREALIEPDGVLDRLYGLENLVRIADVSAELTDQLWQLHTNYATATIVAKLGENQHRFGITPGASAGQFRMLFNTAIAPAEGLDTDIETFLRSTRISAAFSRSEAGEVFRFTLEPLPFPDYRWTSLHTDNRIMLSGALGDGQDHMVSFQIIARNEDHPENQPGNYIIAWEDGSADGRLGPYDKDFTDVVIEISGAEPVPAGEVDDYLYFRHEQALDGGHGGMGTSLSAIDPSGFAIFHHNPYGWMISGLAGTTASYIPVFIPSGGAIASSLGGGSAITPTSSTPKDPPILVPAEDLIDIHEASPPPGPQEPDPNPPVPEPATIVLLGGSSLLLLMRHRRTHRA